MKLVIICFIGVIALACSASVDEEAICLTDCYMDHTEKTRKNCYRSLGLGRWTGPSQVNTLDSEKQGIFKSCFRRAPVDCPCLDGNFYKEAGISIIERMVSGQGASSVIDRNTVKNSLVRQWSEIIRAGR